MTVDEAKKKLKLGGDKARKFEQKVFEKSDDQFSQLYSIIFGWVIQKDGSKKLMSKLCNGKAAFPDKSEDIDKIESGIPYICLVYEPEFNPDGTQARQAYAKIISEEYTPLIFVPDSGIPVMVWIDKNGKKRNMVPKANNEIERMAILLDVAKNKEKWPFVKVVFRKNQ
jgi:hypothetical protein